jgi:hypothetical protein
MYSTPGKGREVRIERVMVLSLAVFLLAVAGSTVMLVQQIAAFIP